MELFNKRAFNGLKLRLKNRGTELRAITQSIIEQGLSHYLECGQVAYLNEAMAVAIQTRTIRTVAMQKYIQDVANVVWTESKTKNGKVRHFKKVTNDDGTKPEAAVDTVYVNATKWYEHDPELEQDKPDMDFNAQLKSLITRTKKAIDDGHIVDKDAAETALVELKKLVA